jgi:hypothetical protein
VRYCEAVITSDLPGVINTKFYCDWNSQLYQSASECFSQCSPLLISKSDAYFLVLLVFSLFVLFLVLALMKVVLE